MFKFLFVSTHGSGVSNSWTQDTQKCPTINIFSSEQLLFVDFFFLIDPRPRDDVSKGGQDQREFTAFLDSLASPCWYKFPPPRDEKMDPVLQLTGHQM